MIQENELISLILLSALLFFVFFNREELKNFPGFKYLYPAIILLFVSVVFTIAEGFILPDILNFLEHFFKAAASIFILLWAAFLPKQGERSL